MNQDALKVALEAIRRRDRFESELRTLLENKGFEVEPVIEYLKGRRFVDDRRVASTEVERLSRKGLGPDRIRAELEARGAKDTAISNAIAELNSPEETAKAALAKKFPGEIDVPRAMRFLLSRGFEEDVARSAIEARTD